MRDRAFKLGLFLFLLPVLFAVPPIRPIIPIAPALRINYINHINHTIPPLFRHPRKIDFKKVHFCIKKNDVCNCL